MILETKWSRFHFDASPHVLLFNDGNEPGGVGKAQNKIDEGGKVNERTRKEEQNKNVTALVRTNLIYATFTFEAQQKQESIFLLLLWGRLAASGLVSIQEIMKSLSSYKPHSPLAVSLSRLGGIHHLSPSFTNGMKR